MAHVQLYYNLHVNQTYQSFIHSVSDMFKTKWFPRCKDVVISTYSKVVERERNRRNNASENYSPQYPFMVFDPNMDLQPEPALGKFIHQYSAYSKSFDSKQWDPRIYEDENIYVAPSFNRYMGTWEMIVWCSSIYELFDYMTTAYQLFGGNIGRYIEPTYESYFVIPNDITLYTYSNPYTGESYKIDWDESIAEVYKLKNINDNRMVVPFTTKPLIKLTGISDGSDKYGAPSDDEIGQYRMVISMEWETWMPVGVILVGEAAPDPCVRFELDLNVGFQYSAISKSAGRIVTTPIHKLVTYLQDEDSTALSTAQLIWMRSFLYTITEADYNSFQNSQNVYVTLPDNMQHCVYLNVYTKFGQLVRDFQWQLISPNRIKLIGMNMQDFSKDDLISFELYRRG